MKIAHVVTGIAAFGVASAASAALVAYEPFEYPTLSAGTSLLGEGTGFGFDGPWQTSFGNFAASYQAASLSNPATVSTGGSGLFIDPNVASSLNTGVHGRPLNVAGLSDTFFSFLIDDDSGIASSGNRVLFETLLSTNTRGYGINFDVAADTGQISIWARYGNVQGFAGTVDSADAVLIVGAYNETSEQLDGGGALTSTGTVTIWVNPTDLSSVAGLNATAAASGTASGTFVVEGGIGVRGGQRALVDEIRFATTLADAVVVPEPASLSLLALGALGLRRRR